MGNFQKHLPTVLLSVLVWGAPGASLAAAADHLANNTVLIVRHAEKPPESSGSRDLTEAGQKRAVAYVKYFRPLREGGLNIAVSSLFAGADSAGSMRPRLTLEPLNKVTGMPLNTSVGTKEPEALVTLLRSQPHGSSPLICWRHGQIPALLEAFGASPAALLPQGRWPDETFDWIIVLRFDASGKLESQKLVKETLKIE